MNYPGMQSNQLDQTVSSFVSSIVASIRNSLIYDPNHSQVQFFHRPGPGESLGHFSRPA